MKKRKSATTENEAFANDTQIKKIIEYLRATLNPFITRKVASELIGISPRSLANLDSLGAGIEPRIRLGTKLIAYEKDIFLVWLEKRMRSLDA